MLSLPKFGLSEYAEKTHFFGNTRHLYEKNEPTLDSFGGGVHGRVCWLIAYKGSDEYRVNVAYRQS